MHFRTLIIVGLMVSSVTWAQGRKPAVEDFVGIEVEHPETTPQASESLVNLEKDIQTIHAEAYTSVKTNPRKFSEPDASTPWSLTNTMAIVMLMGLPFMTWLMVMNRLRKKATAESASNVEVLEKYRREREQSRKKEESTRKAS